MLNSMKQEKTVWKASTFSGNGGWKTSVPGRSHGRGGSRMGQLFLEVHLTLSHCFVLTTGMKEEAKKTFHTVMTRYNVSLFCLWWQQLVFLQTNSELI